MRLIQALPAAAAAILSWAGAGVAAAPVQPDAPFERLYFCRAEAYPLRRFVLQVDDSARRMQLLPARERDEMPAGLRAGKLEVQEQNWPRGAKAVLVVDKHRFACEATHDD